jgi:hypothetical protein
MKAYLTDFVGDENSIDIDCGILKCNLQDAIFEKLINAPTNSDVLKGVEGAVYNVMRPYYRVMPSMSINFTVRQWGYDI